MRALLPLLLAAAPVLDQADSINKGLEVGPIRYIAALSLTVNLGLFGMLMRVQALRVAELKERAERYEKLGGILEKHNDSLSILEKAVAFVVAQQPRKKSGAVSPPILAPEPRSSTGGKP